MDPTKMTAKNGNVPLNLSVNPDLKRLVKIHSAKEGKNVSEITEKLYEELLSKETARVAERAPKYGTKGRKTNHSSHSNKPG